MLRRNFAESKRRTAGKHSELDNRTMSSQRDLGEFTFQTMALNTPIQLSKTLRHELTNANSSGNVLLAFSVDGR